MNHRLLLLGLSIVWLAMSTASTHAMKHVDILDSISTLPLSDVPVDSVKDLFLKSQYEEPYKCMQYGIALLKSSHLASLTPTEKTDIKFVISAQLLHLGEYTQGAQYINQFDSKHDTLMRAHQLFYKSLTALHKRHYESALRLLLDAEELYKKYDHRNLARLWGAIGYYYELFADREKAIEYYRKSVGRLDNQNAKETDRLLINYCFTLFNALSDSMNQAYLDELKISLRRLKSVKRFYNHVQFDFSYTSNMIHYSTISGKNLDESLSMADSCRKLMPKIEDDFNRAYFYWIMGKLYSHDKLQRYAEALRHVDTCKQILRNSSQFTSKRFLLKAHELEGDIYYELGQYEKMKSSYSQADHLLKEFYQSLLYLTAEEQKKTSELTKASYAKAQLKTKNKYLQNIGLISVLSLLVTLVLGIYVFFLYKKNKVQLVEIQSLNKNLEEQINKSRENNLQLSHVNKELESTNMTKERLIERLKQFTSIIVHDFKEPIRTVVSYSGLLSLKLTGKIDESDLHYLDFLNTSSKRLTRMLDVLRQFNVNTISLLKEFTLVDLNKVLEDVQSNLKQQIKQAKATVIIEKSLPQIEGQYELLAQLFQNIISNSLKYTIPNVPPHISISHDEDDNYYYINIEDNGVGIKEEEVNEIFTLFGRCTNVADYEGSGMGLAISKEIVELHQGKIMIENIADKGARVTITFHKPSASFEDAEVEQKRNKPLITA